jgi:hypothetical protein
VYAYSAAQCWDQLCPEWHPGGPLLNLDFSHQHSVVELPDKGERSAQWNILDMHLDTYLAHPHRQNPADGCSYNRDNNELISVGPHLCRNLTHFTFHFDDVTYGAKNSAQELTDEAMIHFVKLCPNLRSMQLQGISGLKDITLEALFRYSLIPATQPSQCVTAVESAFPLQNSLMSFVMLEFLAGVLQYSFEVS